jgi:HPt (histidine-containing phosphotransfer) domain-containing protein
MALADTTEGSSAQGEDPIDRTHLARFTRGDAALEQEVLQLFASQMPLYVQQLRSAATPKEWKQAAHTIKGSALAVGAHRLARLAQTAESVDADFLWTDAEVLRRQSAEAVAAASDEVCRYIACLFATA